MPIIHDPLMSWEAKGHVSGVGDFQTRYGVTVLRSHVHTPNPRTSRQEAVRAKWRVLVDEWANCTREQAEGWREWARAHPCDRGFGPYVMTGANAFAACNFFRIDWFLPIRYDPPYPEGPPALLDVGWSWDSIHETLELTWDGSQNHYAFDLVDIWLYGPLPKAGLRPRDVNFRHASYQVFATGNGGFTHFRNGQKTYVRLRAIQEDGQKGAFTTLGPLNLV